MNKKHTRAYISLKYDLCQMKHDVLLRKRGYR
ncbi:GSCOCG00013321001-RA-CDS [Cotesia congregata]|nr:GSCOCG00013321001-RA-CDS [Cotesia congregata]